MINARIFILHRWEVFIRGSVRPYLPTLAIAGMGVMLSILLFVYVRSYENEQIRSDLERRSADISLDLQRSIEGKLQVLEAFDSFYAVNSPIDPQAFQVFATHILGYQPDIQAISWVPRVKTAERLSFEQAAIIEQGYPNYQITELNLFGSMVAAAEREEYFPVLYVAPLQGNETVIGFDLGSEANRRATLYQAIETGEITATVPITLVQTPERAAGLLVMLPVYQRGAFLETPEQRQENLVGFVTLGLRISDIVGEPLGSTSTEGLIIYMYDAAANTDFLRNQNGKFELVSRDSQPPDGVLHSRVETAGRTWVFDFYATPTYYQRARGRQAWEVLLLGWGFTLMLLVYLYERHRVERTLRHYTQELEARNRELDAYSHTIAHDLKAPLGIVVGYAGFIRDEYQPQLPQDAEDMLAKIQESSIRMSAMIDNLLHLATLRDEEVRPVIVNMQAAAQMAIDRFEMALKAQHIRVVIEPGLPSAMGHAPWIEEVFANLIGNAIKYMGDQNPDPCIVIRGWQIGLYTRFEVQDNGVGIAPEHQKRIFEMFAQVDKNPRVGHGLGLSIVQRIISRLEGQVGVESVPSEGSTFWFMIPAVGV